MGKIIMNGIEYNSGIPAISSSHNYSTTEQVIGTWVDGKPLYEKTIHSGALTKDTNWHNINHGISNLSEFIKMFGIAKYSGEWYEIGTFRPVSNTGIMLYGTTSVVGYMNNYQAMTDSYITLQYTKTTD